MHKRYTQYHSITASQNCSITAVSTAKYHSITSHHITSPYHNSTIFPKFKGNWLLYDDLSGLIRQHNDTRTPWNVRPVQATQWHTDTLQWPIIQLKLPDRTLLFTVSHQVALATQSQRGHVYVVSPSSPWMKNIAGHLVATIRRSHWHFFCLSCDSELYVWGTPCHQCMHRTFRNIQCHMCVPLVRKTTEFQIQWNLMFGISTFRYHNLSSTVCACRV
jgi:hypothetical protein